MASFDFRLYLQSIDPASCYHITILSGGLVNLTVRASKTTASNLGIFPGAHSLILKHAPPFVAMIGPEAPFSPKRQEVEAAALKLFHDDAPLASLREQSEIRVPKVLHHNVESAVLIMEDLGPLATLWDTLSPSALEGSRLTGDGVAEIGHALGRRLGEFFAKLHSATSVKGVEAASRSNADAATSIALLSRSLTRDLVLDAAVKPIHQRLTADDSDTLYERIFEDFDRDAFPGENCFSLGDCHPGAILLPSWDLLATNHSKPNASSSSGPTIAVIDWEFSEISGRGINGDTAQLLASLHCHWLYLETLLESVDKGPETSSTATRATGVRKALAATDALVRGLCTSYAEGSGDTSRPAAANAQRLRSSVILFGRETINQAYEIKWDLEGYAVSGDDLRNKMVAAGVGYLRRAGKDAPEASKIWSQDLAEEKGIISMLFSSF